MARAFPNPEFSFPLLKVYGITAQLDPVLRWAREALALSQWLDCITPNGAVMPRDSNASALKRFEFEARAISRTDGFSSMSRPILRAPSESHPERPYSTEKVHSDVWRGEPRGCVTLIIPIEGCANSTVRFIEPIVDSFNPWNDFAYGDARGTEYDVRFEEGFAYYCDAFCLHQTVRLTDGLRVSVDLRMLYAEQLPEDVSPWPAASEFEAIR